jgi:hypothetical protein
MAMSQDCQISVIIRKYDDKKENNDEERVKRGSGGA